MLDTRLFVFAGHYGSGKTNLAVNWAKSLCSSGHRVILADLDIVNPYFRTSDSKLELDLLGIRLISSKFAGSNVDLPSIPADAEALFDQDDAYGVIDVGGDDRGALALGRYAAKIKSADANVLLVLNCFRPETRNPEDALRILNEIEPASHVRFTGLVNNSNLGSETTASHVLDSAAYAASVSKLTDLPLVLTSVRRELLDELEGKLDCLFPLDLVRKTEWEGI